MKHKFLISGFADEASPSLDEQIALLNSLNVKFIEPRVVNGKNIVDLSDSELYEMKERLSENGISVSCIGSPIGKISIDAPMKPELNRLDRALTAAEILGAPYVRVFSFFLNSNEADGRRNEVLDRFSQFMRRVEGRNTSLAHENEKGIYGDTAVRCLDLMKNFSKDGLKCIFDPANFLQCNEETDKAYKMLREYVAYMHIKDAYLGRPEVVPAGHGDGHIREILSSLSEKEMFLSLEPHLSVSPWMESIMEKEEIKRSEGKDSYSLWALAHRSLVNILTE